MSEIFQLHPQLKADTTLIHDFKLCSCLLMNDARYGWLILVPRLANLRELHDVPQAERTTLFDEIEVVSRALQQQTDAYKINVAALGNQVPQLHIHVIARQQDDPAWPGPVWGVGKAKTYSAQAAEELSAALKRSFLA